MRKFLSVLALSLLCSHAMAQQIYQWTDERGVVQYGERPPVSGSYQQINIKAAPAPGGHVRAPEPKTDEQIEANTQSASTVTAAEQRQAQRIREEQQVAACEKMRSNLETLLNNPRLRRTNTAGEVERIGEDERQRMIQQAREQLKQDCD